jgi:hypothetical protein
LSNWGSDIVQKSAYFFSSRVKKLKYLAAGEKAIHKSKQKNPKKLKAEGFMQNAIPLLPTHHF